MQQLNVAKTFFNGLLGIPESKFNLCSTFKSGQSEFSFNFLQDTKRFVPIKNDPLSVLW